MMHQPNTEYVTPSSDDIRQFAHQVNQSLGFEPESARGLADFIMVVAHILVKQLNRDERQSHTS